MVKILEQFENEIKKKKKKGNGVEKMKREKDEFRYFFKNSIIHFKKNK